MGATGKPKSERMCDNPADLPTPYPSDAAQCLVCLDRDRNFFREAGGFWAHKPEEWRTLRPGKQLPDFVLQRVCRMNNTLPNENKVPAMRSGRGNPPRALVGGEHHNHVSGLYLCIYTLNCGWFSTSTIILLKRKRQKK